MATTGPVTSDNVALSLLYRKRIAALDEYNTQFNLKSAICESVWQDYIDVAQTAKTMKRAGSDSPPAPVEHVDSQTITLPDITKYHVGGGVTQDSIKRGITSKQVMDEHTTAVGADERLVNQILHKIMLTDGQWWDATVAPPRWANNAMASSHDHYLAYNVAGVVALAHVARAKRHITEHGPIGTLVALFNGDQIEKMEVQAEWVSAAENKTPLLNDLQNAGFTPAFYTDGVWWVQDDYVPASYGVVLNITGQYKPVAWRYAVRPDDPNDRLIRYTGPETEQFFMQESYVRWGAAAVQMRGYGVAIYLGGGSWTDPTVSEWSDIP